MFAIARGAVPELANFSGSTPAAYRAAGHAGIYGTQGIPAASNVPGGG